MTRPTQAGKLTPTQKAAQMRIQRALAAPGSVGMKGFLRWTEAAWPSAIAQQVLKAAQKYTPGASTTQPAGSALTSAGPAYGGFGRLGYGPPRAFFDGFGRFGTLGDDSGITLDIQAIPDSVTQAIDAANAPDPSAVTSATPSQPASPSWASDIADAIKVGTVTYLGVQQVKDAQTIFNTNLLRAQQGLPMLPTNPTTYGLPAPTAQVGLTSSAQNTLLVGLGILAVSLVAAGALSGSKRR